MRESDIIAPLGLMSIMGMLAGDKKSNLLKAQIDAYQKEQEEANNKKEEDDEGIPPIGDEFQSISNLDAVLGALDPIGTAIRIAGHAFKPWEDGEIDDFYKGPAQDQVYGGYGFDKHRDTYDLQEGDTNIHGNKVLMDSPLYDAGSPYHDLFADGGLVPPLRGPMSSGIGTLYKLK